MEPRIRTRSEQVVVAEGFQWSPTKPRYAYQVLATAQKRTEDYLNHWWLRRRGLLKTLAKTPNDPRHQHLLRLINAQDWGSPFLCQDVSVKSEPARTTTPAGYAYGIDGQILPHGDCRGSAALMAAVPWETMFARGGKAIYACQPMRPHAGLTVNAAELMKDGVPKIPGAQFILRPGSRSVGDEFLNFEFGVRPTVEAVNDTVKAFRKADSTWQQIVRNDGKDIRRGFGFPEVSTFSRVQRTPGYGYPVVAAGLYDNIGTCFKSTWTTSETWFSGAFRYALPGGVDRWSRFRREATRWERAYGLGLRPIDLYRIAPWSWLLEWFADFSSVISWLGSSWLDGVAMRYGYVMCRTVEISQWINTGLRLSGGAFLSPTYTLTRVTKQRSKASPLGFGLEESDLSPEQLAILTALGLTSANPYRS